MQFCSTCSVRPRSRRTRTPFMEIQRPAPTSRNSDACSNTSQSMPRRSSESAIAKPPMPAPAMRTLALLTCSRIMISPNDIALSCDGLGGVFGDLLGGKAPYGLDNLGVSGAAAEVAVQVVTDFFVSRVRRRLQQRCDS